MLAKKKNVAIIQARMGSTRLPGKVLLQVVGKPLLWHVVNRVCRSKLVDEVVVATSTNRADQEIADFCLKNKIKVFRGSENDVLDRYFAAALKYRADFIVRITADCPLVDPEFIDKLVAEFKQGSFDHMGIATGAGVLQDKIKKYPQGLDASIMTFGALKTAWREATNPVDREHVSVFIWQNPGRFSIGAPILPAKDYSNYRLTVDWPSDLKLIRAIYENLWPGDHNFGFGDVIKFLDENPKLLTINKKWLGKTTENFWRQKLTFEFQNLKTPKDNSLKKINAIVILSAEETQIQGENKNRIDAGLRILKKAPNKSLFIYEGVKAAKEPVVNYLKGKVDEERLLIFTTRRESSTKTQIKDLVKFLSKSNLQKILIVTHAYHILRAKRTCLRYMPPNIKVEFYPVGVILRQKSQVAREINKIIKYASHGDLPLPLNES